MSTELATGGHLQKLAEEHCCQFKGSTGCACACRCAIVRLPWTIREYNGHVQVKMVTSDDEATTDILCEGPEEEIERLRKEFGLAEKGKVLVKGLLER